MKVLVTSPIFPPEISDESRIIKYYVTEWLGEHEVAVLTLGRVTEPVTGATIFLESKRGSLGSRLFRTLIRCIRTVNKYDIVYAHEGVSTSFPAVIVGRLYRIPVLFHFVKDEDVPGLRGVILKKLQNACIRWATHIICDEAHSALITKRFPHHEDKITVHQNPEIPTPIIPYNESSKTQHAKLQSLIAISAQKHYNCMYEITS